MQDGGLTIQWTQMPTYNTIMAISTGAALCSVAHLGKKLYKGLHFSADGNGINFGVLGLILSVTGAHMSIAWPLAKYFPFDNIIFGEPSFGLGVLLLFASLFFFIRGKKFSEVENPAVAIGAAAKPLRFILIALGLSLISIAVAGMRYQLFVAPPAEPIAGEFANQPWIEATFISGLYFFTGVAVLLLPANFNQLAQLELPFKSGFLQKSTYGLLMILGWTFIVFGAMNYFTHIGLIINTMPGK
jgi:uncharacterized membrane protein